MGLGKKTVIYDSAKKKWIQTSEGPTSLWAAGEIDAWAGTNLGNVGINFSYTDTLKNNGKTYDPTTVKYCLGVNSSYLNAYYGGEVVLEYAKNKYKFPLLSN